MIRSMTAFAAAEHTADGISSAVEIRSYNHRYLDTALRISRRYWALEEKIKARVNQRLNRGRIEINAQIIHQTDETPQWEVDEVRADAYHDVLAKLQQRYGLTREVPLELMAKAEGVVKPAEPILAEPQLWEALQPSLDAALNQLCRMREDEGAALAEDLCNHLDQVQAHMQGIERQAGEMVPYYQARLTRRIDQITRGKIEVDPLRIAQEVAFQADRSDISEELVRCAS
ncbi:MAG: YicC/YloC family endoribonuclease, partial [Desulfobacterales bacterium]